MYALAYIGYCFKSMDTKLQRISSSMSIAEQRKKLEMQQYCEAMIFRQTVWQAIAVRVLLCWIKAPSHIIGDTK